MAASMSEWRGCVPPLPPPRLPSHEENESVNESRTLKPHVRTISWKRMSDENELVQNTWWPSNLVTSRQHILTILPHYLRQTPWQCFASTPFLPQLQGLNYSICWCSCHTTSDRPLGSASAPFLPRLQGLNHSICWCWCSCHSTFTLSMASWPSWLEMKMWPLHTMMKIQANHSR